MSRTSFRVNPHSIMLLLLKTSDMAPASSKEFLDIQVNYTETQQQTLKVQRRQWKSLKKWKKVIRSNNYSILWLAYQQVQIFERFK